MNPFFEQTSLTEEQNLLEELTTEIIQIDGINVYYIPRNLRNFDELFETDDSSTYTSAFLIEMYLKNVMGFEGDREFMSKFAGLEIRDQVVFSVVRRRFDEEIGRDLGFSRPREGDLIYFPQNRKAFQIKYVNQYEMFYQLGKIYTWEMTCELFEYSGEVFDTGIADLDRVQTLASTNLLDYLLKDHDGSPLLTEEGDYLLTDAFKLSRIDPVADNINVEIEEDANNYINWDETRPFGEWTSDDTTKEEI